IMVYGTAYTNQATVNCSTACVVTPVAPNTTTSKTTGLTASATLTIPVLQLIKTIDCVFAAGACTPGSYVTGSSIPPSAMLRYKIVYTNPQTYAQTITLSDTVPASTTAAGNLYVASGPDIRPSTPALSVNAAAAGTARGPDVALTALAASSVVNFTPVSLPAGNSGTLYMDVQTNAAAAAVVTNTASINSTQRTAAGGAAVTSAVSATATALTITKASNVSTVAPGGNVIYTITVTNPGAVGVALTSVADTLPKPLPNLAGRTIQCGTTAPTCLATTAVTINGVAAPVAPTLAQTAATATVGQINTWTLGGTAAQRTLNAGQTMTLTFTATYSATVLNGNTYRNSATVNYTGGTATVTNQAPVTVPYNTISVSKAVVTPASASIAPNSPVTYAITVTNTGASPAPITSVVDTLPAAPAGTGTIAYTSTSSVLANGVAQTGVAGAPAAGQYTNPAPAAAVAGTQQVVTWTFPAAGTTINPGQTMVITFVAQFGAIPTNATHFNDVRVNYTGGQTTNVMGQNLAPVSVPQISRITKTIDCVYSGPTCAPGSYVDGTPIPVNAKLGYKIVYENLSALAASGITIADILPTQIVTAPNPISNLIINGVPTAAPAAVANPGVTNLLVGGTLTASPGAGSTGTITFDLQTTATAGAGVTNTGKMTSSQDPQGTSSLATAAAAGGNLAVSKAVTSGTSSTVAQGAVASYTITVTNDGSASATLNSLVDTLPGTPAAAPGTTSRFTYTATGAITLNGATITPAYTTAVTPPAAPATTNKEAVTWTFTGGIVIPAGQSLTLTFTATVGTTVSKGAAAPGATYYNDVAANYSGGAFPSASANGQAAVLVPFDTLTMSKSIDCVYDATLTTCQTYTAGAPIPPNAKLRYKLLYTNLSTLAQSVTIKDTLPASVTAAGNLYVGSGPEVRPSATVLSVNAAAAGAARGADVALTAIAGGTVVAMTAATLPGSSSGSLYIDVQTNAVSGSTVSNCAIVTTAPADTCAAPGVGVTSTNTVSVQNVAVLNISKSTSTANVAPGGTATYTITVTNTGTAPTTSLKVYDFLPYSGSAVDATKRLAYTTTTGYTGGLSAPTISTSVPPTIAPYSGNLNQQQVLWDFGAGGVLAAGASMTITFNATVGSAMPAVSFYNSVRHEYTSGGISFNGNVNNQALISVNNAQPSIMFLKTVAVYSDPVNGVNNPSALPTPIYAKFIPGALADYTLIATNSGTGPVDNNSLWITDPLPANTSLYVLDLGAPGSGPVLMTQGATSSGLTAPLVPAADVSYSHDGGTTWDTVTTPAPGVAGQYGVGCDATITHLRINPKGTFVGSPTAPSPSFNLNFRVCVK
ncbi:MAG: hypothetical protein PXX77_11575, partial [Gallionella sp.]|nr:hypothetical protein [Gallionella sp.]